ncbi:TD and POZ domain-containing protein 1 [Trichonephila clavata]|uniref:TD and POZ domain-containing protein 1 n=1 Tax=Trichonephila clavata TaxID=2740835 RepID=A0A8X6KX75_TRICU|nr:TD and POZ domain-containing protein 1 [Trichonephila clavata]
MTDEINDEYEIIILWNIENYHLSWQQNIEGLHSPIFTATTMESTKWRLVLNPSEEDYEDHIGFYLYREDDVAGPKSINITYIFEILGSDGSVLSKEKIDKHAFVKESNFGFPTFIERNRVLQLEKDRFLPLNTLTVRCRMRRCENKSQERVQMYAKTVIDFEKMSFIWAIDKFSCLKNDQKVPFEMKSTSKEILMSFDLFLREGQHSDDLIFIDVQCFKKTVNISSLKFL